MTLIITCLAWPKKRYFPKFVQGFVSQRGVCVTRAKLPMCVSHRFRISSRVREGSPVKSPPKLFENSEVLSLQKRAEYHSTPGRLHYRRVKFFLPALRLSTLFVQTRLRLESHVENTVAHLTQNDRADCCSPKFMEEKKKP